MEKFTLIKQSTDLGGLGKALGETYHGLFRWLGKHREQENLFITSCLLMRVLSIALYWHYPVPWPFTPTTSYNDLGLLLSYQYSITVIQELSLISSQKVIIKNADFASNLDLIVAF